MQDSLDDTGTDPLADFSADLFADLFDEADTPDAPTYAALLITGRAETSHSIQRALHQTTPAFALTVMPPGLQMLKVLGSKRFDVVVYVDERAGTGSLGLLPQLLDFKLPVVYMTRPGNQRRVAMALAQGVAGYLIADHDGHYFELLPSVLEHAIQQQQRFAGDRQ